MLRRSEKIRHANYGSRRFESIRDDASGRSDREPTKSAAAHRHPTRTNDVDSPTWAARNPAANPARTLRTWGGRTPGVDEGAPTSRVDRAGADMVGGRARPHPAVIWSIRAPQLGRLLLCPIRVRE